MAKDPVCGMKVDEKKTGTSTHAGSTYHFCFTNCKAEFDRNPTKCARQRPAKPERSCTVTVFD